MAKNPFKQNQDYTPDIRRNTFDLSCTNNLTFNMGQLIPVFAKEVLPTDHVRIDPQFALRFMPLVFPVQTKMRAYLHLYYCRNRAVWPNFCDRIYGNTTQQEHPTPFIIQSPKNDDMFRTGGLADYLGIPTTVHGTVRGADLGVTYGGKFCRFYYDRRTYSATGIPSSTRNVIPFPQDYESMKALLTQVPSDYANSVGPLIPDGDWPYSRAGYSVMDFAIKAASADSGQYQFYLDFDESIYNLSGNDAYFVVYDGSQLDSNTDGPCPFYSLISAESESFRDSSGKVVRRFSCIISPSELPQVQETGEDFTKGDVIISFICCVNSLRDASQNIPSGLIRPYDSKFTDAVDLGIRPFDSEHPLNALLFRHYESIYNSYYRDTRNNPFYLNGKPQYNRFVTNDGDGQDDTPYRIYNRNWELDQFTSCTQTPQFGDAPLVGIQNVTKVTVTDPTTNSDLTFEALSDENGKVNGINVSDSVNPAVTRALVDYASSGISINDFRLVNSLQRFLETQIRRGMRYREQSKATWNVDIKFDSLNMPEFIGGVSADVDINTVSCTSPSDSSPLGAYAAQATAFGASGNKISKFCDEHGYIIGILSVIPVPAYSQVLPKHFMKHDTLDWYNPAFANIGNQPVSYHELCPIQCKAVGASMEKTFGYNRPWYDYIRSFDEVHGLFRTNLQNFVLHRTFSSIPELGPDFTVCQHTQLNNPFVTDIGDKILGSIHFGCEISRGIPSISVPSIS